MKTSPDQLTVLGQTDAVDAPLPFAEELVGDLLHRFQILRADDLPLAGRGVANDVAFLQIGKTPIAGRGLFLDDFTRFDIQKLKGFIMLMA